MAPDPYLPASRQLRADARGSQTPKGAWATEVADAMLAGSVLRLHNRRINTSCTFALRLPAIDLPCS